MIKTKKIYSIITKLPKDTNDCIYVNVLTWHDERHRNGSKYHKFSPFVLKTDGQEVQKNKGGILFENYWQGSKVWPIYYDIQVWAHRSLKGKRKHLWFQYKSLSGLGGEYHFLYNRIESVYYLWRDALFSCKKPIRYPNGVARASKNAFHLCIDEDGNETRLNHIQARKKLYVNEYSRLIRKLKQFRSLLELLKQGKTLVICETDVPDDEIMTLDKLENLIEDNTIKFGHGLCLARELLMELGN